MRDLRLLMILAICVAIAAGVDSVPEDAEVSLRDALAATLEANWQFAAAAEECGCVRRMCGCARGGAPLLITQLGHASHANRLCSARTADLR